MIFGIMKVRCGFRPSFDEFIALLLSKTKKNPKKHRSLPFTVKNSKITLSLFIYIISRLDHLSIYIWINIVIFFFYYKINYLTTSTALLCLSSTPRLERSL